MASAKKLFLVVGLLLFIAALGFATTGGSSVADYAHALITAGGGMAALAGLIVLGQRRWRHDQLTPTLQVRYEDPADRHAQDMKDVRAGLSFATLLATSGMLAVGLGALFRGCEGDGIGGLGSERWSRVDLGDLAAKAHHINDNSTVGKGITISDTHFDSPADALAHLHKQSKAYLAQGFLYWELDKQIPETPFLASLVKFADQQGCPLYIMPALGKKEEPRRAWNLLPR